MISPEKSVESPTAMSRLSPRSPNAPAKKSPKPVRAKSNNPPLNTVVLEVLKANKGSKGVSLKAIKNGIIELYPDMQENFSNVRLHKAISKGIDEGSIIRPKGSEDSGFTGRFLVNRTYISEKEKEAKQKMKEKEKKKTASKTVKKAMKPRSQSPTAPSKAQKDVASKKTPIKISAKGLNSLQTKELSKMKKATINGAKTSNITGAKKQKSKSPKTEAKKAGSKTPKTVVRKKTASTPKVSKSATAGAKQKTASAKKLNTKKTAKK